jgi:hypothetical protein
MVATAAGHVLAMVTVNIFAYVGLRQVRLAISTDGGGTWADHAVLEAAGTEFYGSDMLRLANGDILAATTTAISPAVRIFRSTDDGANFTLAQSLTGDGISGYYGTFAQTDNGTVFLSDMKKVYKSSDNGVDWTETSYALSGYVKSIFASGNRLFVIRSGTTSLTYSDDGGDTFATPTGTSVTSALTACFVNKGVATDINTVLYGSNNQSFKKKAIGGAATSISLGSGNPGGFTVLGNTQAVFKPEGQPDIFALDWFGSDAVVYKYNAEATGITAVATLTAGELSNPYSFVTLATTPAPPGKFWTRLGGATQTFS